MILPEALDTFWEEHDFSGKGSLSLALIITRRVQGLGLPVDPDSLLTKKGGQVSGLSGNKIKQILARHNITRTLSSEGGRTSRGSIDNMRVYVDFLNDLYKRHGALDFDIIELWWINKVREYFQREPFQLNDRGTDSIRSIVTDLLDQAMKRRSESPGSTYTGTMLQHLVGAKLELSQPEEEIEHHAASVADQQIGRHGDFLVGDAAIHVTTAPSDALGQKCVDNLNASKRPIVITLRDCFGAASQIAKSYDIENEVEVFSIEEFIATNIQEWSGFRSAARRKSLLELIARYNELVEEYEKDPSLRISTG